MHTNLIAPLSCCRESVKYTCICKMSEISTYRKKKKKRKNFRKHYFSCKWLIHGNNFKSYRYIPNTSEDQPTFSKTSVIACKTPCCFKSPLKITLNQKKVRHQKLFSLNNLASVQIAENISSCGHKNIPLLILILGVV